MPDRDWLGSKHPIYEASRDTWIVNERRLRGGKGVLQELRPFEWEKDGGPHHEARKAGATYINFPDIFATSLAGFLLRDAPAPDGTLSFGTLGEVRRERAKITQPTEAELIFYNTNGVGNDGSQWNNYWHGSVRRAMATGHRWHMIESPEEAPGTFDRILKGIRPYAIEFSPLSVPNWHYERGLLAFAFVKFFLNAPKVEAGKMLGQNSDKLHTLVLVRQGFAGLGTDFEKGGWFLFDPDNEPVRDGRWDSTQGQIPFFPHFYEQDDGSYEEPAISRSALTELGQLAVSYMNVSSAADYDAWDAACSTQIVIGASKEAFNRMTDMIAAGAKYAALQHGDDALAQGATPPTIHDASTGAVPAEIFRTRLEMKNSEAERIAAMESSGTPDASGISKEAGFADTKGPRLANVAANLEQAQNTAIHFFEQRFGHRSPAGSVTWKRDFDLVDLRQTIKDYFALVTMSGIRSPAVEARAMLLAAQQSQLIPDDGDSSGVLNEFKASAQAAIDKASQQTNLLADFGM
jgi:hypothetical protein